MNAQTLWDKIKRDDADFLIDLWHRWQDEKDYEDINDYLKAIQRSIPQAYKITKRPFGIRCRCDGCDLVVQIKRNGKYLNMTGESKMRKEDKK